MSPNKLTDALADLGVRAGDKIILHGDAAFLLFIEGKTVEEKFLTFIQTMKQVLGPSGLLLIPGFTYSYCRNQVFDIRQTPPAKELGRFSQLAHDHGAYFRRSFNAIFSFYSLRMDAQDPAPPPELETVCFGPGSFFEKVVAEDYKLAFFGCSIDRATIVHHVERTAKVSYRYDKKFSGTSVNEAGMSQDSEIIYYVRDLELKKKLNLLPLKERLTKLGKLQQSSIGRVGVFSAGAKDFFEAGTSLIAENEHALLEEVSHGS